MGKSLIGGLIANGHSSALITAADPDAGQRESAKNQFGIEVFEQNKDVLQDADVVVLAVKPQSLLDTLKACATDIQTQSPLLISIAAGVRLAAINKAAGGNTAIVRVMPNTPALIGAGASALFGNEQVSEEQRELAEAIMRSVGLAIWLENEDIMDTVTALSGSGPAYFFLVMEALEKGAIELGLTEEQARLLTLETAFGAAKMAMESDADPATLRKQVTSPGGTTEQALKVLMEKGNLQGLFAEALAAARQRSIELAKTLGKE